MSSFIICVFCFVMVWGFLMFWGLFDWVEFMWWHVLYVACFYFKCPLFDVILNEVKKSKNVSLSRSTSLPRSPSLPRCSPAGLAASQRALAPWAGLPEEAAERGPVHAAAVRGTGPSVWETPVPWPLPHPWAQRAPGGKGMLATRLALLCPQPGHAPPLPTPPLRAILTTPPSGKLLVPKALSVLLC